jgi:hypothetical protein
MFAELIRVIQDAVKTEVVEAGGQEFTTKGVFKIPDRPTIQNLKVATLNGFLDYIKSNPDGLEYDAMFIQVVSPTRVELWMSVFEPEMIRPNPASADCNGILGNVFEFEKWHSIEELVVKMQAKFVKTDDSSRILATIGNICDEDINQYTDDGVTQTVKTKSGINRKDHNDVPGIVTLQPKRTFPEIEQPASSFVFRLRKDDRAGIQGALFDADSAAWKAFAIAGIADYLREKLAEAELDIPVIA